MMKQDLLLYILLMDKLDDDVHDMYKITKIMQEIEKLIVRLSTSK